MTQDNFIGVICTLAILGSIFFGYRLAKVDVSQECSLTGTFTIGNAVYDCKKRTAP